MPPGIPFLSLPIHPGWRRFCAAGAEMILDKRTGRKLTVYRWQNRKRGPG